MSGQNVPQHFYTEFARNLDFLAQQQNSRLGDLVETGSHSGEKASPVDQIGAVEMTDITGRFEPIGRTDSPLERRWVFPVSSDLPQMLDTFDALKLLTDPKSAYVQNAHFASMRRKDRHIITGFFADALTGVNAGTTETFGTTLTSAGTPGQNVSVGVGGAASGLNAAKMKEGLRRLREADVDLKTEQPYMAVTSDEHDDLLNEIQVISLDFNDKPVLVDGIVTRFLGVRIEHTELLGTGTDDAAGTSTMIPLWVKRGMYYGTWQNQVTDISPRKDLKGLPWQAYVMMTGGATRLEKVRTIRIWAR
jgi:hypothetical protein